MALKPPPGAPWVPPPYAIEDVGAIQALQRGDASPDQQQRALRWIIEQACATYEMSFSPEHPHWTFMAEGRRFAGNQIVKLIKLNLSAIRRKPHG